jgi:hypothetical protein
MGPSHVARVSQVFEQQQRQRQQQGRAKTHTHETTCEPNVRGHGDVACHLVTGFCGERVCVRVCWQQGNKVGLAAILNNRRNQQYASLSAIARLLRMQGKLAATCYRCPLSAVPNLISLRLVSWCLSCFRARRRCRCRAVSRLEKVSKRGRKQVSGLLVASNQSCAAAGLCVGDKSIVSSAT